MTPMRQITADLFFLTEEQKNLFFFRSLMSNLKFHRSSFIIHHSPLITSPKSQCGGPIKSPHCIHSRTALSLPTHHIAFFAYRSSFTIPIPTKTGNTKIRAMMEKSSPPHDPTAKENQKRSSCPSIRNGTDFILRKQ